MDLVTKTVGKHLIFDLKDKTLDMQKAQLLKKEIFKILEEDESESIVFDMTHLTGIDSSGFALIAQLNKKLQLENKSFYLINVSAPVLGLIRMASMDSFLKILPNEDSLPS